MNKLYCVVVGATVGVHFAYLIYLPSGGFLALRWPRGILLHIPAVLWGAGVVVLGFPCPLTQVEQSARTRAGMNPLPASGFVDRYIAGVCYPANRTGIAQLLAFVAAGVSWIVFGWSHLRRKC
ncbi:DUF2784 domain-containing protein [Mycobacterium noviomagense]|uniref:DUF2784 domain-containing protein n=2 Tax=Mycobacterium noviomagense TaxID=459858 RepID=A0A7I7PGS4_9MYCO|nr:DUF2784 domain-containing protein [Mycobacterium noviomagense]ORB12330.1 hypothetical protein BST37_16375 [Mycobacterium noviomagense]BBY07766.1 hypothetical protein MNVI_30840 [Mycobacterium noviomagense]